jgi:dihydrofolate synthase/folylpolyglutamate synthase
MFTRIGAAAIKKDLTNTLELCKLAGNPEASFKSIHIAGTNGKGSVSHMLAAILQCEGYKTGLYTSPHLKDFRERIRINGQMISEEDVVDFVNRYKPDFERIKPSFFEMTVMMAFEYFAKNQVDIAIIETGLGGRLDSTNVITPELSIITNIGWDHKDMLGDTLQKIAGEKAGIIKKNVLVLIGENSPETDSVFIETARLTDAPIYFAADLIEVESFVSSQSKAEIEVRIKSETAAKSYTSQLAGNYQRQNIRTVLAAVELVNQKGKYPLSEEALIQGLANTTALTGLMGRWQVLKEKPLVVADVAHNVDGIQRVMEQVNELNPTRLHLVIGMVKDKDIEAVLRLLPEEAVYYFCNASIPRALPAETLLQQAAKLNRIGNAYSSPINALTSAEQQVKDGEMVLVCGSIFTVAEVI